MLIIDLGPVISEDGRSLTSVKNRIALAKEAFNKRKELLTKGLSTALKKRMIKLSVYMASGAVWL